MRGKSEVPCTPPDSVSKRRTADFIPDCADAYFTLNGRVAPGGRARLAGALRREKAAASGPASVVETTVVSAPEVLRFFSTQARVLTVAGGTSPKSSACPETRSVPA